MKAPRNPSFLIVGCPNGLEHEARDAEGKSANDSVVTPSVPPGEGFRRKRAL